MVNFRDHSKEELDRLSDSKSILKNNNKSFFTSPPGLVPPFGILIHQVGNVLNPTLSYRAGGSLSQGREGQRPEGGGGHDLRGQEGPHCSGNGLCHSGKTYSKILFNHESSWLRVDAQIRSENELIYSRD